MTIIYKIFNPLFEGFSLWKKSRTHDVLMEKLRTRIIFSACCGILLFSGIILKLSTIMIMNNSNLSNVENFIKETVIKKADILDRNGEILSTSIVTASCFVDPSVVIDINETAQKLSKLPGMPKIEKIKSKLKDKNKHFVWIARHITPQIQEKIMDLGLPGVQFQKDYKRIYVHGSLFSHIVGCTDIDGKGVCGIEKKFNNELIIKNAENNTQLALSLDLRIQAIIHEELSQAVEKFKACGGSAILMGINGEILGMVSLPDFDPNNLKNSAPEAMFNRNTLGAFEQGSILKILNVAIALDSGSAKINSVFDASCPIKIGKHSITDFKGKGRPLTLAEAFVFSSNIASVKIAQGFGVSKQKAYMKKFGMLDKVNLEIPENGSPLVPSNWSEATCMTVSYGYGLAITPLQLLCAVTSIVNNGYKVTPTILYGRGQSKNEQQKTPIVSRETSVMVRELMRAVVCFGTGRKAGVEGISIFGKTGTAYKISGKGYGSNSNRARITTFLGGFPKENPQYMLMVVLDNPKPIDGTYGYATAGWNVAPTAKNILNRVIPLLYDGESEEEESELIVTKYIKLDK